MKHSAKEKMWELNKENIYVHDLSLSNWLIT